MWFFKSCIGHTRSVAHLSSRRHADPRRMMARMTRALMGQMLLLPQSIDRTKSGGSVTQWLCPLADTSSVWDQAQPMQLNWCSKKRQNDNYSVSPKALYTKAFVVNPPQDKSSVSSQAVPSLSLKLYQVCISKVTRRHIFGLGSAL